MKFRIHIFSLLTLAVLFPAASFAETGSLDQIFSDVEDVSEDLRESILQLVLSQTIHGYSDGTYRPNAEVTKKEFMKLAVAPVLQRRFAASDDALTVSLRQGVLEKIADAAKDHHLLDPVFESGSLDLPATRADAVQAIIAAYRPDMDSASFTQTAFIDIYPRNGDLARKVDFLVSQGIVVGRDPMHFVPQAHITRAEAAKFAYLAEQRFLDDVESEDTDTDDDEPVRVTSNSVQILNVTPRTLSPGDSATVLFSVMTKHGSPITDLEFGDDLLVTVTKSQAQIASQTEIGSGLYSIGLTTEKGTPEGPICVRIILLRSATSEEASTCDWDPPESTSDTRVSLARLVPSDLDTGQEAAIVATPRSHNGDLVSGLTLVAQVVKGNGEITQQMAEDPAGSGVYIGRFTAGLVASDVQIRVRIDNTASNNYTIIYGTIRN